MCCTSTAALPQACNSYHCTGAVLDGAAIVGVWLKLAVNAGFVLTEIDHRAAQFKTYETWHADAVRVHAALMAFLEARYTAFEQQCAQNKGDRDPGDPSYALDKAGSAQ